MGFTVKTILAIILSLLRFTVSGQFDYTDLPYLAQAAVRASTGFNPLSLSNMVFWFKADDYKAQANGTALTTILDKTTNGNHATNPVSASSPTLTNNVINGKSAFHFLTTPNSFTQISNSSPFGFANNGELFAVLRSEQSPAPDFIKGSVWQMNNVGTAGTELRSLHPDASSGIFPGNNIIEGFGSRVASTAPLPWSQQASNWHIYSVSISPSNMQMRANGELFGGNDLAVTGFTNTIWIGKNTRSGTPNSYNGYISEIMCFSNVLSLQDRSNVTMYFSSQYGISTTNTSDVYTPTNFPNLVGWWDADSLTNIQANGVGVTNWSNSASLAMKWTNGTSGERPTWRSNAYNGHACLTFNASVGNRMFVNPTANTVTNPSGSSMTIISVGSVTNNGFSMFMRNSGATLDIRFRDGGINQTKLEKSSSSIVNFTAPRGMTNLTMDVIGLLSGTGQMIGACNMTNTTSSGATNLQPLSFDNIGGSPSFFLGGDVCEVLYYQTNLSIADLTKLYYTYFRPKWGLP